MKIDFHIHTKFSSDAFSSPKDVVDAAIEKNIDCICITDHAQIKGGILAMKYGFDKNILVIPGIEVFSLAGDILGINVKKIIPDFLPPKETIKEIQKQGGIAVIPHPFWLFNNLEKRKKVLLSADAIEVFNADMSSSANRKALAFSNEYHSAFTAGSDAHKAKFVGRAYLEIPKDNLSEREVVEQIKNKAGFIHGTSLSFLERIENASKIDIPKLINYYFRFKKERRKILKNGGQLE